ncbi:BA75_00869T0 [Komagataella pastoris]|uniref:Pantoate--beta-alanine ligase n=1 Tax=Komagataella pastoris TaxID=4922 RepID=A0A1B2J810_PICPA|nr:BA75_00869T0 [Komagataella pastoris]
MTNFQLFRTIQEVRDWRLNQIVNGHSVGFVPTMGALHEGHLTLVRESLNENDKTVVSIFVNPSQFAPTEDLESYPRTLEADLEQLAGLDCSESIVVFVPTVREMYPSGIPLDVSLQKGAFVTVLGVSEQLEGKFRPQFFRGVATVVCKLFNIVYPNNAYFGSKDIQQTIVVRRMVKDLLIPTNIRVILTCREKSGLAMSSRNQYLSSETKMKASQIYRSLLAAKEVYDTENCTAEDLESAVLETLKEYTNGVKASWNLEYVCVNEYETLDELNSSEKVDKTKPIIVSLAIHVPRATTGTARLIDNIVLGAKSL